MKILFLTSRLPYPPIGGDKLKNYNLLKILSKHFDVHLVAIADQPVDDEIEHFLRQHTASYKIFEKTRSSFYLNALKSLTNRLPLQVNYYYFRDIQEYILEQAGQVDLIYSTLIRTAKYTQHIARPKILDIADSVGLNYLNSAQKTRSVFWRSIYKFDTGRLLAFERKSIANFDRTLFFNKDELLHFGNGSRTCWIPHGVNNALLSYEKVDQRFRNCVTFLGKMDVQHNIDAVNWFCERVLPHLHPDIKFTIVGAYPRKCVVALPQKYQNVEVTGYVKDPYQILKASICVVAPLQTGAGIQNKILEAMALATVVVSTSFSARAIAGATDDRELLVEDDPKRMANRINDIYQTPEKYAGIKQHARDFIGNNFTWKIYERNLLRLIKETMRGISNGHPTRLLGDPAISESM